MHHRTKSGDSEYFCSAHGGVKREEKKAEDENTCPERYGSFFCHKSSLTLQHYIRGGSQPLSKAELQVYKGMCCKQCIDHLKVCVSAELLRRLLVEVEHIIMYCSLRRRVFLQNELS